MQNQERCDRGFEIYKASMAKSSEDKAEKIVPILRQSLKNCRDNILDLGAGGGELTQAFHLVAQEFKVGIFDKLFFKTERNRTVKVFAMDKDPRMIKILEEKFRGQAKIKVINADARNFKLNPDTTNPDGFEYGARSARYPSRFLKFLPRTIRAQRGLVRGEKFAAVICSSILHEIFSERGNLEEVKLVLKNIYNHLLPQGTLIIRDGVKPVPEEDVVFLQPFKPELFEKFQKILDWTGASWLKIHDYRNPRKIRLFLALSKENAYELAVKYQYPEINWPVELKEKFGFWTKEKAKAILEEIGFNVTYSDSYLLPYFAEMFSKDFKIFKWQDGPGTIEIPYFDTHLVIAAKKSKRGP